MVPLESGMRVVCVGDVTRHMDTWTKKFFVRMVSLPEVGEVYTVDQVTLGIMIFWITGVPVPGVEPEVNVVLKELPIPPIHNPAGMTVQLGFGARYFRPVKYVEKKAERKVKEPV